MDGQGRCCGVKVCFSISELDCSWVGLFFSSGKQSFTLLTVAVCTEIWHAYSSFRLGQLQLPRFAADLSLFGPSSQQSCPPGQ